MMQRKANVGFSLPWLFALLRIDFVTAFHVAIVRPRTSRPRFAGTVSPTSLFGVNDDDDDDDEGKNEPRGSPSASYEYAPDDFQGYLDMMETDEYAEYTMETTSFNARDEANFYDGVPPRSNEQRNRGEERDSPPALDHFYPEYFSDFTNINWNNKDDIGGSAPNTSTSRSDEANSRRRTKTGSEEHYQPMISFDQEHENEYPSIDDFPSIDDYSFANDYSSIEENERYLQLSLAKRKTVAEEMPEVVLAGLNPSQHEAVTAPFDQITRVVAGPGAGKTRVLTSRIAYLLYKDQNNGDDDDPYDHDPGRADANRVLAVTFTKKAAGEMQRRLVDLCSCSTVESDNHDDVGEGYLDDGRVRQENVGPNDHPVRPPILDRTTVGTFHSVCARMLRPRRNGNLLASLIPSSLLPTQRVRLDGSFTIADQSEQLRLIKDCLKEADIDLKKVEKQSSKAIKPVQILNAVCRLKHYRLFPHDFDVKEETGARTTGSESKHLAESVVKDSAMVTDNACKIFHLYTEALYSKNVVDFDDLILLTRLLLRNNPHVLQEFRATWKHVLVDEFQDTSKSQLDLVKLWTTDSLMVVGDSDQSIYTWRGANGAESMNDVAKAYIDKNKKVDTVYLMENYRSTSNIVKAAQRVINGDDSNDDHKTTKNDEPSSSDARRDMKPIRGKGPTPRILACADSEKEANWVIDTVKDMMDNTDPEKYEHLDPSSFTVAVLYRTNAQSRILEEACVARNVRYAVRGASGTFYSRAEIKDCLCFLRWLRNEQDAEAMRRCFRTPSRGIGDVATAQFVEWYGQLDEEYSEKGLKSPSPLEALLAMADDGTDDEENAIRGVLPPESVVAKRAMTKFVPFAKQMKRIREKAQVETVSGLLEFIIDLLGIEAHVEAVSKTSGEFADRWQNVMELRRATERYDDDGPSLPTEDGDLTPLTNFLDDVALLTDIDNNDDDDSKGGGGGPIANLMTIHAAKGMEFDAVFVVGNEEGTFPTQRSINEGKDSAELEEERRLCYVAITRAKTHLFLTWRREVTIFVQNAESPFKTINTKRSRFLDTLVAPSTKKTMKKTKKGSKTTSKAKKKKSTTSPSSPSPLRRTRESPSLTKKDVRRSAAPRSPQGQSWADWDPPVSASLNPNQPVQRTTVAPRTVGPNEGEVDGANSVGVEFDSTILFPVGSGVVHTVHGRGVVLDPPPPTVDNDNFDAKVRVRFESSGFFIDFPMTRSGLRRIY